MSPKKSDFDFQRVLNVLNISNGVAVENNVNNSVSISVNGGGFGSFYTGKFQPLSPVKESPPSLYRHRT